LRYQPGIARLSNIAPVQGDEYLKKISGYSSVELLSRRAGSRRYTVAAAFHTIKVFLLLQVRNPGEKAVLYEDVRLAQVREAPMGDVLP
jgi:hypothetical protein